MPTDSEIAHKALTYLKTKDYSYLTWFKTKDLLVRAVRNEGWDVDHLHFRNIMNRLHSAGVVQRVGVGAFKWKLKPGATWSEYNPFIPQKSAPPKPAVKEEDTPPVYDKKPDSQLDQDYLKTRDVLAETQRKLNLALDRITELSNLATTRAEANEKYQNEIKTLKADLEQASQKVRTIHVHYHDGTKVKLKDKVLPKTFDRVKTLAECRRNVLLVGPAGSGKSYLAKLVADVLNLKFGSLSCTAGMSEAHVLGRSVPDLTHGKNRFQSTDFLRIYEEGGVFLLDELDAADPNLLLCINTGLANGYLNVPNRPDTPRALRHPDFVCIATANTMGRGATRMYAGRNQLDEATLDRFRIGLVEVDYDPTIEAAVCPDIGGKDGTVYTSLNGHAPTENRTIKALVAKGYNLRQTCQYVRHKIEQSGMRRIMSTRFLEDAYVMMSKGKWTLDQVLEAYFSGWTPEEAAKVC